MNLRSLSDKELVRFAEAAQKTDELFNELWHRLLLRTAGDTHVRYDELATRLPAPTLEPL